MSGRPPNLRRRESVARTRCVPSCICLCHEGIGDVEHLGRPCYGKPGSTDVSDFSAALPPYDHTPVTTTDGLTVVGWSWPPAPVLDEHDEPKPRRCKCSHGPSTHTGGHGRCWQTPCCCESYRDPKETA